MAQAVIEGRVTAGRAAGIRPGSGGSAGCDALFFSAAFLSVVISVAIIFSLAGGAFDFLSKVELSHAVVRRVVPAPEHVRRQDDPCWAR